MKRILFIATVCTVMLISATGFTGKPFFTDIPGGNAFSDRELLAYYDYLLGSTNSPLDEIPTHDIYYNGNFRFSFSPRDFVQITLLVYSFAPFSTAVNADFNILPEGDKIWKPALHAGIQNLSWDRYASTEGEHEEYDHLTYDDENFYSANSVYVSISRTISNFVLVIGLGGGKFVGFSEWSERVSIGGLASLFGGIGYRLKLGSAEVLLSAEEDGRDFNMAANSYFNLEKITICLTLGVVKAEHWFQSTGFQPKFRFALAVIPR